MDLHDDNYRFQCFAKFTSVRICMNFVPIIQIALLASIIPNVIISQIKVKVIQSVFYGI